MLTNLAHAYIRTSGFKYTHRHLLSHIFQGSELEEEFCGKRKVFKESLKEAMEEA